MRDGVLVAAGLDPAAGVVAVVDPPPVGGALAALGRVHADADAQGRHQQVPLLHPSRDRRETLSRIPDRESSAAVELEGGQDDEREMPSGDVGEMK